MAGTRSTPTHFLSQHSFGSSTINPIIRRMSSSALFRLGRRKSVLLSTSSAKVRSMSSSSRPRPSSPPPSAARAEAASSGRRLQIPEHVAAFGVLLVPVLVLYAYYEKNHKLSNQELEEELRQQYASEIKQTSAKNKHMQQFFQQAMQSGGDGSSKKKVDEQINEVLYSGKGRRKRLHAVDETLYGTAEGVAERKRMERVLQKQQEERRERKKKKATGGGTTSRSSAVEKRGKGSTASLAKQEASSAASGSGISVLTLVGVAAIAASIGFLAGGGRETRR